MDSLPILLSLLLFPGIVTALALGLLFRALARGGRLIEPGLGGGLASREGLSAVSSILLAGLGLAALPWPLHPAPAGAAWLWAWAGFEAAYLIVLVPALLAGAPRVVRAAVREAQLGAFARALLWGALALALALRADWSLQALPAHLLAALAALALLPAAILWGPFASEQSVTPGGSEAGLPPAVRGLLGLAADARAGALSAALVVAVLPSGQGPGWLGLAVVGGGVVVIALVLRRLAGRLPRLALPSAIRLGLLTGAPLLVAAALALALAA